jgi:hypothetical protein
MDIAGKTHRKVLPRRTRRGDAFLAQVTRDLPDDESRFQWLLAVSRLDFDALSRKDVERLYREAWFIILGGQGRWFADLRIELSDLDL